MAVNITATRTSTLFTDGDGDGIFDPGDVILTRIRITNSGTTDATGVSVTDTLSGVTLVPGSVMVTPIAYDDAFSLTGNTPITIGAAQGLLLNDVDPDGAGGNAGIVVSSVDTTGTQGTVSFNANGSFTFTPTTGFVGVTSFKYFVTDAQGLGNVTEGIVTMTVTGKVWYVDATYAGANGASDGSYLKPFTTLTPLNNNAVDVDGDGDTIFVYNTATYNNAAITLENNQKFFGDGHAFIVNNITIGANASNTTLNHTGAAITLGTGNTIDGFDLVGSATGAVGIQDNNGTVGSLTVTGTNITGQGQIIDIDQGGALNVTLGNVASTGSTGANGGVVDLTGVSGTVTVTGTTTINGTHSQAGIDISNNTGGVTVAFQGNVTVNTAANTAINITNNTGTNAVTFSGGVKDIDTTSGTALNFTGNTTSTTVSFTGGGLDVDATSGTGLNMDNTTLVVSGAGNAVNTTTGNVLAIANSAIGAGNISFDTLGASGTVAAGAGIIINNLDNGTFSGGNVTVFGTAGASADGLNIQGGSSATFSFASATIGGGAAGTNPIAGDAIELNGANGAVTFTTVNLQGSAGNGVNIVGATNAVTISGGTIGTTNDPGGDGVNVNGGTGAVTVAAAITKTTGGNEVVDISGHATGAVSFSGAISSSSGGGGIRLVNNTSGNIDFTNTAVNLNTGTLNAITFTNTAATGANVTFTGGNLNVDTTSGTGINATNTTVGAGSLTISGSNNSVLATTGRAINVDGVTLNSTFHDVGVSGGGTTTGVFLKNTGASGQFVITGTAGSVQGSGGTIANITGLDVGSAGGAATTGTGIYMENVSNVSISNMIFGSTTNLQNLMSNFGIRGENVNNFTLTDSEFRGTFGNSASQDEGTIRFGTQGVSTGLTGTAVFQGNNIGTVGSVGAYEVGLAVFVYGSSTLNITIKDTAGGDAARFGENYGGTAANNYNDGTGTDSFLLESGGTSNVTVTVTGVDFTGSRGDLMQIASAGNTTQNITITGNNFLNGETTTLDGGAGVAITGSLTGGTVTYNIDGNTFKGSRGSNIFSLFNGSSGTVNGIVNNNTFGTENNTVDSSQTNYASLFGGAFFGGIDSKFAGTGTFNYALRFSNNNVQDIGGAGVLLRSANQGTDGTARLEATISNNSFDEISASNIAAAIYAQVAGSGHANGDDGALGMNISNNSFDMSGSSADGVTIDNTNSLQGVAYMPGYTGNANINAYLVSKGNSYVGPGLHGNPNGTVVAQNFVLAVPMMAATPQIIGNGWEDFEVSPVTAPPRDPDTTPDSSGGGQTTGQGGETREESDGGGSGGGGTGGGTGGGAGGHSTTVAVLTQAALESMVDAAIQRWVDAGASADQVAAMRAVDFSVVDMTGIFIGASTNGIVQIDDNAAGLGWFVDSTPGDDSEFSGSGTSLTAVAGGGAEGKLDLLTVLMHELGHQIGLSDHYNRDDAGDLMYGYANAGERRLPADGDADGAIPGSIGSTAFALTPVSVGTLPSNKVVDVYFKATIDNQFDKFITNLSNTATISGSNFSNVQAVENNNLDTLTLGNTVFKDNNLNGVYDAGEGVAGVALQLYADTNDSGGWDAGDVLLGSTTTIANGAYSFTGLAPGDYIVVVTAANFGAGQPLQNLLIVPGVAADPDNNVDNDNNGVAATGGAVASQTITLAYNTEPTAGTGNDTNNTLDFGFYANQPPVANDDSVSVAEDSGANDLTSQLLANDTDPENDTRTITGGTNGAHGTVSVVAGVLTYTPTANYNGTDIFTYMISDGNGNSDTATANVTVTAVNDPVTGTAPASATVNEDAVNAAITGMSISDVDTALAPSGVYDVTLSSTHGTMTLTTLTGLTFTAGDGTGDTTMTFHGTLADINTALATAKYSPDSNYNGSAQITLQVTDQFGVTVATGTGSATNDTDNISVTVTSINDAPAGTDDSANAVEGVTYTFVTADFSDGFSDPNDTPPNAFNGVKITTLPSVGAGVIKLNGVAINAGDIIAKTQLDNSELTFVPAAGSGGTSPTFTFQVQDDGGTVGGGVNLDQSANTFTFNIAVANVGPVLDLDANDSSGSVGTGYAGAYTEGGAATAISDTDVSITDADAGDDIVSAIVTITNPETGDKLNVGALPTGITLDGTSTDTMVKLVGIAGTTQDDFEIAIQAITFSSTSDDPTDHGTNNSRSITVVVNDGDANSNTATATIAVTDVNDAPSGTSSTITAVEDTFRLIQVSDLGFGDVDGSFASVTITAVTGGKIYVDADGTAGAGAPVEATLPVTFTAQDLIDGKASFLANPNANGTGIGSITFTVADDDGASSTSNALTVDVTAVNDSPVLTATSPVAVTEQVSTYILTGANVSDVDLDARNGGNGDYAGAVFSVNRNPASDPVDDFELVAGANFTIDGINLKTAGGQIFGHISADSNGIIAITFTSLETAATSALVDEVMQSIRYYYSGDNPPASVTLAVGFTDGSPGGGQGSGASGLDVELVTVNITAVNDAPVNSLGGTIGTGEDAVDAWLSGMSISDPDANPATDAVDVTFAVANGTLDIRTDVVGGITAADIVAGADDSATMTVRATLNQINATLAASNGLTYSPNLNFNGDDTLTVTTNDRGFNGTDPGLTGNGTSEQDVDTRTISVSPVDDPADAVNDSNSVNENATIAGASVIGNDTDVDGPNPVTVEQVNGSAANVGTEITLASGAKLTLNSDGTYNYNPNGKFNTLTSTSTGEVGAKNTTAIDTFTYKLVNGDTATVTITINGVASPQDRLEGDSGDDTITGTPNADLFYLVQGGNDNVSGLGSNDIFYFGATYTNGDTVNGGAGSDIVALQGDYSVNHLLGSLTSVESISLLSGANTNFGDLANNFYDYFLTSIDSNVAAGQVLKVNGGNLRAGEDFTFDGTAETDGSFLIYGGLGKDTLLGGGGNDVFVFAEGRLNIGDVVNGNGGYDSIFLRGDYVIDFTSSPGWDFAFSTIENLTLASSTDIRYASGGSDFDYNIVWDDTLLANGKTMTINGGGLVAGEDMVFNGAAETNGFLKIYAGAGNDVLTGGANADLLYGGGAGDTLTGGGGNDVFRYDFLTDSNSTERDGIQDFTLGDKIDLSKIDAMTGGSGNDAFTFIGNAAFSNTQGELRFENISLGGPIWLIQGDVNGDGVSDFELVLVVTDANPITASDFFL